MSLVSWQFGVFVLAALAVYHVTPRPHRTPVLAALSFGYYAAAFPAHALLLAAVTGIVWWIAVRMRASSTPRRWLAWGVTGVVALLAAVKYVGFAAVTLNGVLRALGVHAVPAPSIVAPLGISFISFGLIHYLVSVYRGEADAAGPLELAAYASFFPTVTSGPIKRFPSFLRELREGGGPVGGDDVAYAAARIVVGLAKKIVLADTLYTMTAPLRHHPAAPAVQLLVAIYAYTLYIYLDFSGYSDMAIGISRLFGFRIIENFNWPYLRRNVAEFWSAWHISLTRFITEYVFIPLGGSRTTRAKTARNTLVAMAVSGLWHGAAWHYVAWGLYHGVGLVVVRWWRELIGHAKSRHGWFERVCAVRGVRWALHGAAIVVTFNFVAMGWVLFAVPLTDALAIYARIGSVALKLLRLG